MALRLSSLKLKKSNFKQGHPVNQSGRGRNPPLHHLTLTRHEQAAEQCVTPGRGKFSGSKSGLYDPLRILCIKNDPRKEWKPDSYDASNFIECSNGIHFLMTYDEALEWCA